uniref:Uncharacterized protein n=1 Tax=Meloidogyne enterolobii TaxID=390850 RepID=A0A6V7TJT8_MELEN|nr:unnamed protein product [Meloidogyne enterolobii]
MNNGKFNKNDNNVFQSYFIRFSLSFIMRLKNLYLKSSESALNSRKTLAIMRE